jgi:uncharacterized protein (DUF3820 family)
MSAESIRNTNEPIKDTDIVWFGKYKGQVFIDINLVLIYLIIFILVSWIMYLL